MKTIYLVCGLTLATLLGQASAQSAGAISTVGVTPMKVSSVIVKSAPAKRNAVSHAGTSVADAVAAGIPGGIGVARENRILRVATNAEATSVAAGATFTLFSATGAGSVERVQLAVIGDVPAQESSAITITVDGVRYAATTGVFFLNKWQADGGLAAGDLFATKNIANTFSQVHGDPVNGMGTYRKIYIPYYKSISITYTNASSASAALYSQVDYYAGAAPTGLHPATQNYFHMYTYSLTSLAQFNRITLLPSVAGPGQLDSIFLLIAGKAGAPQWLEANPSLHIDDVPYTYGGTEDFFGGQYYFVELPVRTDEFGVARLGLGSHGNFYTTMYRYFHDYPVVFHSSLSFDWANGQKGQGTPPTINAAANIVYYTQSDPGKNPAAPVVTAPRADTPDQPSVQAK
jgi:DUF2961 family protein